MKRIGHLFQCLAVGLVCACSSVQAQLYRLESSFGNVDAHGICVTVTRIYVSDYTDNTVKEFAHDGSYLGNLAVTGTGTNDIGSAPDTLSLGPNGAILVGDYNHIYMYSPNGSKIRTYSDNGNSLTGTFGIVTDSSGVIWSTSYSYYKFNKFGDSGFPVSSFATEGPNWGITQALNGDFLIAGTFRSRIERWSPTGTLVSSFSTSRDGKMLVGKPMAMVTNFDGHIFVSDLEVPYKVGIWTEDSDYLDTIPFDSMVSAIATYGPRVYVGDSASRTIKVYVENTKPISRLLNPNVTIDGWRIDSRFVISSTDNYQPQSIHISLDKAPYKEHRSAEVTQTVPTDGIHTV